MQGSYVLENSLGQVVRTFHWKGSTISLVYRADTRRVVPVTSLDVLDDEEIPYTHLTTVSKSDLQDKAVKLSDLGYLRWVPQVEVQTLSPSVVLKEDDKAAFWKLMKWLAIVQISLLALVFGIDFIASRYFSKVEEVHIVTVTPQTPHQVRTVEPMKKKNTPVVAETTPKKVPTVQKPAHAAHAPIQNAGVLGVLGALQKSSNKGGLDVNAIHISKGPGLGGAQGSGGTQTSFYGKGLVAANLGPGMKVTGAGGYGTKGKGGGQAGYGKMSMIGSSKAYFEPVERDAVVEGGLDREQIAEVIQRHLGEVRLCYEQGIQVNPNLAGRVAIKFLINGVGVVSTANTSSTSLHNQSIENCIVEHLKTWKFPEPRGHVNVKVNYPFVLKRVSQS